MRVDRFQSHRLDRTLFELVNWLTPKETHGVPRREEGQIGEIRFQEAEDGVHLYIRLRKGWYALYAIGPVPID